MRPFSTPTVRPLKSVSPRRVIQVSLLLQPLKTIAPDATPAVEMRLYLVTPPMTLTCLLTVPHPAGIVGDCRCGGEGRGWLGGFGRQQVRSHTLDTTVKSNGPKSGAPATCSQPAHETQHTQCSQSGGRAHSVAAGLDFAVTNAQHLKVLVKVPASSGVCASKR